MSGHNGRSESIKLHFVFESIPGKRMHPDRTGEKLSIDFSLFKKEWMKVRKGITAVGLARLSRECGKESRRPWFRIGELPSFRGWRK
jgi:hypothetical protein